MPTNNDYQKIVEKKFHKSLKDVMYMVCIEKGLEKWDGAKELGVPTEIFVKWRTKYRFGPLQYAADMADKITLNEINEYKQELESIDIYRECIYQNEVSLRGFKELAERILELRKMKQTETLNTMTDDFGMLKVIRWEKIIKYIEQYESGSLQKQFNFELKNMK